VCLETRTRRSEGFGAELSIVSAQAEQSPRMRLGGASTQRTTRTIDEILAGKSDQAATNDFELFGCALKEGRRELLAHGGT
jgi:hypothetical protein